MRGFQRVSCVLALLGAHSVPAPRIAQLATEMQAGHVDQYGNQMEGTERYQQIIKRLVKASTGG